MKELGIFKTSFDPKQALRWEKIRAKRKPHFILVQGTLLWAGFMILILNALHAFVLDDPSESSYLSASLVVWPIAGLQVGLPNWNRSEASYKYFKSQNAINSLTQT